MIMGWGMKYIEFSSYFILLRSIIFLGILMTNIYDLHYSLKFNIPRFVIAQKSSENIYFRWQYITDQLIKEINN
jgi:hypothetical protein